ncbi:hypothetical protein LZ30DRAFT_784869 [Colletotrichum cereale]|nr:hypothetical protein LZ30DRAFT_784869 [Colletotrichum cereale]
MVLLEMATYLALLILDFFCSLFDAGHHAAQTLARIILAAFARFAYMAVGTVTRLFATPVLSWMGYGPGGFHRFLGPASWVLYRDFVPAAEFIAHLQRMAAAWYSDW